MDYPQNLSLGLRWPLKKGEMVQPFVGQGKGDGEAQALPHVLPHELRHGCNLRGDKQNPPHHPARDYAGVFFVFVRCHVACFMSCHDRFYVSYDMV